MLAQEHYGPLSLSFLQHLGLDLSGIRRAMLMSAALEPKQFEAELHLEICTAIR